MGIHDLSYTNAISFLEIQGMLQAIGQVGMSRGWVRGEKGRTQ